MGKTRTEAEDGYREEIRRYLLAVQIARQWSQSEIARKAGVHASSINRAFSMKHTLEYRWLLSLASESGVPIPESLTGAARASGSPTRPAQSPEKAAEEFKQLPEEWQEKFLKALKGNRA